MGHEGGAFRACLEGVFVIRVGKMGWGRAVADGLHCGKCCVPISVRVGVGPFHPAGEVTIVASEAQESTPQQKHTVSVNWRPVWGQTG
jgi:hypothetical protein